MNYAVNELPGAISRRYKDSIEPGNLVQQLSGVDLGTLDKSEVFINNLMNKFLSGNQFVHLERNPHHAPDALVAIEWDCRFASDALCLIPSQGQCVESTPNQTDCVAWQRGNRTALQYADERQK